MPIENRELTAGTRLVARYKKEEYTATVVEGEKGGLRYRLEDGREFKSPSAAGSAVTGGVACNGWRFWSVAEEGKAPAPKAERKAAKDASKKGLFERLPDQEEQPEGMARYFCSACMDGFLAPVDQEPTECPKGHQPDGSPVKSAV
jgi:rubrerythrin